MTTDSFGWDLLYSSVENDVNTHQDILVCLAHLVLVSNGFRCVGLGNSKIIDGSQRREGLPKGWNEEYAIRYVYQDHLYIFKATSLDGGVMLNMTRADEETASLVHLKTSSVKCKTGCLEEMIPDHRNIMDVVKKQLFEKVVGYRKFKENSSQTQDLSSYCPSGDLFKNCTNSNSSDGGIKVLYKERTSHLKT